MSTEINRRGFFTAGALAAAACVTGHADDDPRPIAAGTNERIVHLDRLTSREDESKSRISNPESPVSASPLHLLTSSPPHPPDPFTQTYCLDSRFFHPQNGPRISQFGQRICGSYPDSGSAVLQHCEEGLKGNLSLSHTFIKTRSGNPEQNSLFGIGSGRTHQEHRGHCAQLGDH